MDCVFVCLSLDFVSVFLISIIIIAFRSDCTECLLSVECLGRIHA